MPGSSSLGVIRELLETAIQNTNSSLAGAYKKEESSCVASAAGGGFVREVKNNTVDQNGEIVRTNIATNIAITNSDLFVVSNPAAMNNVEGGNDLAAAMYTQDGSFKITDKLTLTNNAGLQLHAARYNPDGTLPNDKSLKALEVVDFTKDAVCLPKQTTKISINANFRSNAAPIEAAGVNFSISSATDYNSDITSNDDIILPEKLTTGGLKLGDQLTLESSGAAKTVIYGGIAMAKVPKETSKIFGASTTIQKFTFPGAPGANDLQNGQQLKIIVNGVTYKFTANSREAAPKNGTFNSMATFAAAINHITDLNARFDTDGILHIAAKDANHSISFVDANGGRFKAAFGLTDVPASPDNVQRFNTKNGLIKAVNDDPVTYKLKAYVKNGDIKLSSLKATDKFNINIKSAASRRVEHVTIGDGTAIGQAKIHITAPRHELKTGDFVRLTDVGAPVINGNYVVGDTDENGFCVYIINNDPTLFPGAGTATHPVANNAASWEKIAGRKLQTMENCTINAGGGNNATAVIDLQAIPGAAPSICAQHDIVHISGVGHRVDAGGNEVLLPDGYYKVTAVGGGGQQITVTLFQASANPPGPNLPQDNNTSIKVTKIGTSGNPPGANFNLANPLENHVMATIGGAGSNKIRLYNNHHNYNIGDYIKFSSGLPDVGLAVDGVTVRNNVNYKVVAIGPNKDYLDFEVFLADGVTPDANAVVGDGDANPATLSNIGQPLVIDDGSRTAEYLGIEQDKKEYDATYDSKVGNKSMFGGNIKAEIVHSIIVYDTNGDTTKPVTIMAAPLANKTQAEWAVEIVTEEDGIIAAGTIKFDKYGNVISSIGLGGIDSPLRYNIDGIPLDNITIDWSNTIQTAIDSYINYDQNGYAPGVKKNIEYNDGTGDLEMVYTNGIRKPIYKLLTARFAAPNELKRGACNTYNESYKSGPAILYVAEAQGNSLEESNVNDIASLIKINKLATQMQFGLRNESTKLQTARNVLSELSVR
ncbi:MAG: hypothetical protein HRU35_06080 [Rickettsiaceae bacterium]|nr:hypothetical protein [Rickettsiaceae bacterium]